MLMETQHSEAPIDGEALREDFPIFSRTVRGHRLAYLDSAASAQKPRAVISAVRAMIEEKYANVHRGAHFLGQEATDAFEAARDKIARFVNAGDDYAVVFTRNATEAVNLVAASWGRSNLREGDEIVLSDMEHHANIVPWQLVMKETGARLRVVSVCDDGSFPMDLYEAALGDRTRLVAMTHCSNVLGTIPPIREIVRLARERGAVTLVDGAQAVAHVPVDVDDVGADFYTFTGHKLYSPTGIGVLCGRRDLLNAMPPYQGGGEMIARVTFERTTFREAPARFEAGTPPIVEAVGLGAAVEYLTELGMDRVAAHDQELLAYAVERLSDVPGVRFYGTAPEKVGILSFTLEAAHPHDVVTIVDRTGVAVRAGHHCAQPLMDRFGIAGTVRASFGVYSTPEDVDALAAALGTVREILG